MAAETHRIHRLLRILTLIQAEEGWTADRLARHFGVAERTIFRDMNALAAARIPYFHDPRSGGYRIRRDFFMPPVELTLDESLALAALTQPLSELEQVPLTEPAFKAIAKIKSQLPAAVRRELDQLEPHLAVKFAQAGPFDGVGDTYDKIRQAIHQRKTLRCDYESIRRGLAGEPNETARFLFEPYVLFFCQRAWYAVGHHHGRDALRCLKLNRFVYIDLTDRPYTMPAGFDLADHLGNAWRMIRGERDYDVQLHFDPRFADTIADTHWHHTQEIAWHEDGSITFRCRVSGLEEIVWWVLSMGPYCQVIQPPELIGRVRDLAARTAGLYGCSDTAETTP